jgi:hypothetical protein
MAYNTQSQVGGLEVLADLAIDRLAREIAEMSQEITFLQMSLDERNSSRHVPRSEPVTITKTTQAPGILPVSVQQMSLDERNSMLLHVSSFGPALMAPRTLLVGPPPKPVCRRKESYAATRPKPAPVTEPMLAPRKPMTIPRTPMPAARTAPRVSLGQMNPEASEFSPAFFQAPCYSRVMTIPLQSPAQFGLRGKNSRLRFQDFTPPNPCLHPGPLAW